MKFETLLLRYKNLGYEPKGLEEYLEIESIIKWVYDTYDIYINIWYCNLKINSWIESYKKYQGEYTTYSTTDYAHRFTATKYFENPYDAKFDSLRYAYGSVKDKKFMKKFGIQK